MEGPSGRHQREWTIGFELMSQNPSGTSNPGIASNSSSWTTSPPPMHSPPLGQYQSFDSRPLHSPPLTDRPPHQAYPPAQSPPLSTGYPPYQGQSQPPYTPPQNVQPLFQQQQQQQQHQANPGHSRTSSQFSTTTGTGGYQHRRMSSEYTSFSANGYTPPISPPLSDPSRQGSSSSNPGRASVSFPTPQPKRSLDVAPSIDGQMGTTAPRMPGGPVPRQRSPELADRRSSLTANFAAMSMSPPPIQQPQPMQSQAPQLQPMQFTPMPQAMPNMPSRQASPALSDRRRSSATNYGAMSMSPPPINPAQSMQPTSQPMESRPSQQRPMPSPPIQQAMPNMPPRQTSPALSDRRRSSGANYAAMSMSPPPVYPAQPAQPTSQQQLQSPPIQQATQSRPASRQASPVLSDRRSSVNFTAMRLPTPPIQSSLQTSQTSQPMVSHSSQQQPMPRSPIPRAMPAVPAPRQASPVKSDRRSSSTASFAAMGMPQPPMQPPPQPQPQNSQPIVSHPSLQQRPQSPPVPPPPQRALSPQPPQPMQSPPIPRPALPTQTLLPMQSPPIPQPPHRALSPQPMQSPPIPQPAQPTQSPPIPRSALPTQSPMQSPPIPKAAHPSHPSQPSHISEPGPPSAPSPPAQLAPPAPSEARSNELEELAAQDLDRVVRFPRLRDSGMPMPIPFCPDGVIFGQTTWYHLNDSRKDATMCTSCYPEMVSGTQLEQAFTSKQMSGMECAFRAPAARRLLRMARKAGVAWPIAKFLQSREGVLPCPGPTEGAPTTAKRQWYGVTGSNTNLVVCRRCYLDNVDGTPWASRFETRKLPDGLLQTCDMSIPFAMRSFFKLLSKEQTDPSAFDRWVAAMSKRLALPPCDGTEGESGGQWFTTRPELRVEHLAICKTCCLDYFAHTTFATALEPANLGTSFSCAMANSQLRDATALSSKHGDIGFWHRTVEALVPWIDMPPTTDEMALLGSRLQMQVYYTLRGPSTGFNVCAMCFLGVFVPRGVGNRFQLQQQPPTGLACTVCRSGRPMSNDELMGIGEHRSASILAKLNEAVGTGVWSVFDNYICLLTTVAPCRERMPVVNATWYGFPEVPICSTCWMTFGGKTVLAQYATIRGKINPEETVCSMYSEGMRRRWLQAGNVPEAEIATEVDNLREFGISRQATWERTHKRCLNHRLERYALLKRANRSSIGSTSGATASPKGQPDAEIAKLESEWARVE